MNADLKTLVTFYRTGQQTGEQPAGNGLRTGRTTLRPALLSGYRDLSKLRYDFPLVLVDGGSAGLVRSLTDVVNELLRAIAPKGISGERIRKNVLALETEIRRLSTNGEAGTLAYLWELAANHLVDKAEDAEDAEAIQVNLAKAKAALRLDGEVIDCNADTAVKLATHLWRGVQSGRNDEIINDIKFLTVGLAGVLEADYRKTADAQSPDEIKASVAGSFADEFDFAALSTLLTTARTPETLSKTRRDRITAALETLESQRFFAGDGVDAYSYVFESAPAALAAYAERLPEMAALLKAVRIAQLELNNEYDEATHDAYFDSFDATSLKPEHIAVFPSYLVTLGADRFDDAEKARVMEILASDLPIKLLVQADDVASNSPTSNGQPAWDGWHMQLGSMAVGLSTAYVLQSGVSHLYQSAEGLIAGLRFEGPALFSVFAGSAMRINGLTPYLVSAAAVQARAFASFIYDPSAGDDLASRFQLVGNPQVDAAWPVNALSYEDDDLQRVTEEVAFSFADFAVCDERHAGDVLSVPRAAWSDAMTPLSEFLEAAPSEANGSVPYILVVDEENHLQRAVVTEQLVDTARRIAGLWRGLQELGGKNNSHALRLLERERAIWEQEKQQELDALKAQIQLSVGGAAGSSVSAPAVEVAAETPVEAPVEPVVEAPPSDEAYIETARCNSCNECITLNGNMFAYNDDKQAIITDLTAGSYRQLVEAAEKCQVAIIHPGKPINPDEPGVEELVQRAAAFN